MGGDGGLEPRTSKTAEKEIDAVLGQQVQHSRRRVSGIELSTYCVLTPAPQQNFPAPSRSRLGHLGSGEGHADISRPPDTARQCHHVQTWNRSRDISEAEVTVLSNGPGGGGEQGCHLSPNSRPAVQGWALQPFLSWWPHLWDSVSPSAKWVTVPSLHTVGAAVELCRTGSQEWPGTSASVPACSVPLGDAGFYHIWWGAEVVSRIRYRVRAQCLPYELTN